MLSSTCEQRAIGEPGKPCYMSPTALQQAVTLKWIRVLPALTLVEELNKTEADVREDVREIYHCIPISLQLSGCKPRAFKCFPVKLVRTTDCGDVV